MALIRPLFRLCSDKSRVLAVQSAQAPKFVRHASAISCMTNGNTQTFFAKERWCKNRSFHQDNVNLDSKQSSEKIRDEKEAKEDANANVGKPLTQGQKLRKVFAEYGSIAVAFHTCISLTSLGICYCAVKSGLDVPMMLQKVGLNKGMSDSALTTGASTFVIAYACHKVFVPVRMFLTITCTPLIVRRLRLMGILKTPAKTNQ